MLSSEKGSSLLFIVCSIMVASILIFSCFSYVAAGENCALQGGKCRNACSSGETAESGAFDDCEEKQECCVVLNAASSRVNCCIYSFDAKKYGQLNCGLPEGSRCLNGSGSPAPCDQLTACKKP